jgi:hypothetical protein
MQVISPFVSLPTIHFQALYTRLYYYHFLSNDLCWFEMLINLGKKRDRRRKRIRFYSIFLSPVLNHIKTWFILSKITFKSLIILVKHQHLFNAKGYKNEVIYSKRNSLFFLNKKIRDFICYHNGMFYLLQIKYMLLYFPFTSNKFIDVYYVLSIYTVGNCILHYHFTSSFCFFSTQQRVKAEWIVIL